MKKVLIFILLLFTVCLSSCTIDQLFNEESNIVTYDVSNDYFKYNGFSKIESSVYNSTNKTMEETLNIVVLFECEYDLTEASMTAKLYNNNDVLLSTVNSTIKSNFKANTESVLSEEVSDNVYNFTEKVVVTFSGKSTTKPEPITKTYTVTFVSNNSTSNFSKTVESGKTISKPTNPTKENFIFSYWCTDEGLTKEYDFSNSVTSNLTLYAKYDVDYKTLTNKITSTIMKSNVLIRTKSYNSSLGIPTSSTGKSGSGIIFYESSTYYFALTNNHVTVKDPSYESVSYTVEDYKGNSYKGYVKDMKAAYDLSVVYFKKTSEKLNVISMASKNPEIDEDVISLGSPKGQGNAITYGKVLSYPTAPKLNNCETYESNVTFNVMRHNAPIDSGSSGGAVLDVNLNLVGINYASASNNNQFVYASAIPITKVKEFLNKYIYS